MWLELSTRSCSSSTSFEQFGDVHGDGLLRFAIEAERLARDVRDALQFLLGHIGEVARRVVERRMIANQVEGVGDGGQGIVDFVRDDARDAAHGGQLFGFAQGFFGLQLRGDVAADLEDGIALVVHGLAAGDDHLGAVLGSLHQVALPGLLFAKLGFDLFLGNGKNGLQHGVNVLAHDLFPLPAIESSRRRCSRTGWRHRDRGP